MKNQDGSALLAVLIIGMLGMIVGTIMLKSTQNSINRAGDRKDDVVLLNIAEAGKEHAIALLKSGKIEIAPNHSILVVQNPKFNGGAYAVSCSSSTEMDTLWLSSAATYFQKKKSIEAVYAVDWASKYYKAYDNAITAGGSITWSGSGWLNAGLYAVHCNKIYSMNGTSDITAFIFASGGLEKKGSGNITGNVWAPWFDETGSGRIIGIKNQVHVDTLNIPVINTAPYYEYALGKGQVYNSDKQMSGSASYSVPGGIMWVNGNFRRTGSGDFVGCIIATGNIELAGSGNYFKVEKYPLALSINGKIDFSGSGNLRGLLFAMNGDFEKTGSGNVTGTIICNGNLRKTGGWNFLAYEKSVPQPPGPQTNIFTLISWREN